MSGVEVAVGPPVGPPVLTWPAKSTPTAWTSLAVRPLERFGPAPSEQGDGGNALLWGDNREALVHLLATGWRERVRLIYIDPPYASNGRYARKVRLRNQATTLLTQQIQYLDQWPDDSYLQFMYERLLLLRELLAPNGSLWLHCDYRQMHRLHLVLEEVFGAENYLNTIAWRSQVTRGAKVDAFYFPYSTQYIEIFAKDRRAPTLWHPQRKQLVFTRRQAAAQFMEDAGGFFRTSDPGTYSFGRLKELYAEGRLYAPYGGEVIIDHDAERVYASKGGNIGVKYYLTQHEGGRYAVERGVDNVWDDIPGLGTTPGEDVGYPTQKTLALLKRIIGASTDPDDWVLDAFAGSGTTPLVAQQMGRRWLACDDSYGAIQTIRGRLQAASAPFGTYAVGDVALPAPAGCMPRGEVQIQRLTSNRDRIEVAVRNVQAPAVAALLAERRHAPVADWREVVNAIEIDPSFDGTRFCPQLADTPQGKRTQVTGLYTLAVPAGATTVAVRITDVLGNEQITTTPVP